LLYCNDEEISIFEGMMIYNNEANITYNKAVKYRFEVPYIIKGGYNIIIV